MDIQIIKNTDLELQKKFLFFSIWLPETSLKTFDFNDIMEHRYVKSYYANWGNKKDDLGFFAVKNGKVLGMVQIRKRRSPTLLFADLPELVISVLPEHRNEGVGTFLINIIIANNKSRGIRLNVHKDNISAINLYRKNGFDIYFDNETDFVSMVLLHKEMIAI